MSNTLISVKKNLHLITVITQIAFWKSSIASWDPFEQITHTPESITFLSYYVRGQ